MKLQTSSGNGLTGRFTADFGTDVPECRLPKDDQVRPRESVFRDLDFWALRMG